MWLRRGKGRSPGSTVTVPNVFGLGDGSPFVLAADPDLDALLAEEDPVPPQAGRAQGVWSGPGSIRFALVIGYLAHPEPTVRARAIDLGIEHCGHTFGFQDLLVGLAADPDPVVRLTAVRAVWTVEADSRCERAVRALRDEVLGATAGFGAPVCGMGAVRARAALDLLVRQAPDEAAREELRALIDRQIGAGD